MPQWTFCVPARTKIGFKRARPNIGAFWTVFGNIRLNSHYYTYETPLDDLRIKTLIIHEARHLQQGMITALSVYGELDAWQLEFGIYHRVKGDYPHAAIGELMTLPLGYDRDGIEESCSTDAGLCRERVIAWICFHCFHWIKK